jgi:hypothetical protein
MEAIAWEMVTLQFFGSSIIVYSNFKGHVDQYLAMEGDNRTLTARRISAVCIGLKYCVTACFER